MTQQTIADRKVKQVMHEFKQGTLKSGSGDTVRNRKQAIAIGLSEARDAGANVAPKAARRKRATVRTASAATSRTRH